MTKVPITYYLFLSHRWITALNAASAVTTKNVMLASLDKEAITVKADINPPGSFLVIFFKCMYFCE
jgi:hypothetical protein